MQRAREQEKQTTLESIRLHDEAYQILEQRLGTRETEKSSSRKGLVLIGTLAAFVLWLSMRDSGQQSASAFRDGAWLIGALLIHELGHLLAMKAFRYRDVTMFFIPFFGAAVSGRHEDAKPWQEALVSLAGPLPGILFGVPAVCYGKLTQDETLYEIGILLVSLNAINLLPIKPLDGGRFFEAVIFCRWRWVSLVFSALSLVGFAVFLVLLLDFSPLIVGFLALFQMSVGWTQWKVRSSLHAKAGHVFLQANGTASREQADLMFEAIRAAFSPREVKPAALAEFAFQHLRRRPQGGPPLGQSLALTLLYLLTLAYIAAGFVVLVWMSGADSAA